MLRASGARSGCAAGGNARTKGEMEAGKRGFFGAFGERGCGEGGLLVVVVRMIAFSFLVIFWWGGEGRGVLQINKLARTCSKHHTQTIAIMVYAAKHLLKPIFHLRCTLIDDEAHSKFKTLPLLSSYVSIHTCPIIEEIRGNPAKP